MIYWALFLHFYQPPTQNHLILKKVCAECYRPLLKMLLEHRWVRVTINICGVLTEMLNEHGAGDVLQDIKKLAQHKQLEFVESAKYHAILPLIPNAEIRRQIDANYRTNRRLFAGAYQPRGFFPPEMCYSNQAAEVVKKMGYDWIITSGIACPGKWPLDFVNSFICADSGMKVIYRDDILSNKISFNHISSTAFIKELMYLTKGKKDAYIVTAMDAETFGHHIRRWERLFLARVFTTVKEIEKMHHGYRGKKRHLSRSLNKIIRDCGDIPEIKIVTISELLKKFPIIKSNPPRPSSWSTTQDDLRRKNYYPLWKDPQNRIHILQWRHLKICLALVKMTQRLKPLKPEQAESLVYARNILDEALHSCQFWWANKGRGMWDTNMINKGLMLQEEVVLNAVKAINLSALSEETKRECSRHVGVARACANKIRELLLLR